jgi:alkylhydroperoxidase family enzyme
MLDKTAPASDKVKLVKPNEAQGEIAEIFEDIRKVKGPNYLTPTWGFFALDVDLLRHWWGLTKRLQMVKGDLPKPLLNSISLVCAAEVDCPRCINNHQTHLIEHFGMTEAEVFETLNFETSSKVDPKTKAVLRFARKVAFAEGTTEEDFAELRRHGISDVAVAEIVSMAMMESGMARHAVGVAPFEDGDEWPRENLPSKVYAENVNR